MDQNFDEALESFRAVSEQVRREHFAHSGFRFAVPGVEVVKGGRKYVKLVTVEYNPENGEKGAKRSVHAFVDRATGDIFMPASWKAPAKHARGNIFRDAGKDSLTPEGFIYYLR